MYKDAQTFEMAFDNAVESEARMLAIESYSPAPDMPAKSSTFADDLTMTVASSPKCEPVLKNLVVIMVMITVVQ